MKPRYLLLTLILCPLLLVSCGTEVDAEFPAPEIEQVIFNPSVFSPGESGEMHVGIQLDRKQPLTFTYNILILDGGELEYNSDDFRSAAGGQGSRLTVQTHWKSMTVALTVPDTPGEYAFALEVYEEVTPDKIARDTVTVTVTQ